MTTPIGHARHLARNNRKEGQIIRLTAEVLDSDGKGALNVQVSEFARRAAPLFAEAAA